MIAPLYRGGAKVGRLHCMAGLGAGVFVELAEGAVIGDGGREIFEVELGEAPGEEFLGPERDGACGEVCGGELDVGLARRG